MPAAALLLLAAASAAQPRVVRAPLQRSDVEIRSPEKYVMRTRADPKTGQAQEYDPKPRIVPVDLDRGHYDLRWIGYDGKEKNIRYERPDRVRAIVAGEVAELGGGRYRYRYRVQVLPDSRQGFARLVVQNFTAAAAPVPQPDVYAGTMATELVPFREGQWWSFSPLSGYRSIPVPGPERQFELDSPAPPAIVGCRISGSWGGVDGVGEEPPAELFDALAVLRYEAWPWGRTIGPSDRIRALSPPARAGQFLEWLPEFRTLGWITREASRRYEDAVKKGGIAAVAKNVSKDLADGQVTSEVVAIVRGLEAPGAPDRDSFDKK